MTRSDFTGSARLAEAETTKIKSLSDAIDMNDMYPLADIVRAAVKASTKKDIEIPYGEGQRSRSSCDAVTTSLGLQSPAIDHNGLNFS